MIIKDDLSGVVDASMCIGCGACEHADPGVKVTLNAEKLIFEPDNPSNARAASVCPAVGVDFAALHAAIFPGQPVTEFGVVDSVFLAQSTDYERNMKASSGGLIKELLLELLRREDVDGIIALDHVHGLDFQPRLVTDEDEIDRLPGSIYHNLEQGRALEILRQEEGRFVLVAIPCQLEGIYSYITKLEPELLGRIHTTIGLLCGWQYSHHSIHAIADYQRFDPATITDVSYRGGGPVGKLTITTDDGSRYTASRRVDFDYQVAFDRHFNTPRCHLCINHSNFLADIVVGDAWLPSTLRTKTGISLVTCRTPRTRELLRQLESAGRVITTQVTTEEIRESQTDRVAFGDFAYAYADYLDEIGVHHPDMVGPNRGRANLRPRSEVEHFHRELHKKQSLMAQGRYRRLRWRKATVESRRFLERYLRWFLVRVVRIKSLFGKRQELPREQVSIFR